MNNHVTDSRKMLHYLARNQVLKPPVHFIAVNRDIALCDSLLGGLFQILEMAQPLFDGLQ